ncbi:MAG: preprotein translocase subunit SecA [Patescibacteria group bacterium]
MGFLSKFFPDGNARVIKSLKKDVERMNAFEDVLKALSDDALKEKTAEFRTRLASGEKLETMLNEAFAVCREAARRTLGQRHYDVQLMGGLMLHKGGIAEMRTGEGKTLTATVAVYANALVGKGVHLITVNDYLAKRDAAWMGRVFHFLGLTVGCIQHESGYVFDSNFRAPEQTQEEKEANAEKSGYKVQMDFLRPGSRKDAYAADITYGTNNEFGFDYLRDNMAQTAEAMVQRGLHFAIVDEVDSILIDEARTPLIISAPAEESSDTYYRFAEIAKSLVKDEDYNIDEKLRTSTYTEKGLQKIEAALGVSNLYETGLANIHHAEQALRAQALFTNDKEYVVRNGEVVIVDEFTGRMMEGRRYSDGLHQAIEAKEGVKIQRESKTLATITFQNYFRLYTKLSGMTGTAVTEAEEFAKIYNLDVTQIPTHRDNKRNDLSDKIFRNEQGKWMAVVREVKERHEKGQPVLIGTVSIDKNQLLSKALTAAGIQHKMLNAKNHEQEAEIIAQAGRRGAVTLATNMAGRGVDILLGGNPQDADEAKAVRELGGLLVIGTERHESRRIDNQLRGRAGRQGDPGETQFFVSLDDDLMRIFGSDRIKSMMKSLGIPDDEAIVSSMVTRSLEKAQQRVEGHHFDTRKHVLQYDDVLNKHRLAVYTERRGLVTGERADAHEEVMRMIEAEVERVVHFHTTIDTHAVPKEFAEGEAEGDWNPKEMVETFNTIVTLSEEEKIGLYACIPELSKDKEKLLNDRTRLIEETLSIVRARVVKATEDFGDEEKVRRLERSLLLRSIDGAWMRHLDDMTYLRRTIGLQGYAQRDPLVEYKKESFRLYAALREDIAKEVVYNVIKMLSQAFAAQKFLSSAPDLLKQAAKMFGGQNGASGQSGSMGG